MVAVMVVLLLPHTPQKQPRACKRIHAFGDCLGRGFVSRRDYSLNPTSTGAPYSYLFVSLFLSSWVNLV